MDISVYFNNWRCRYVLLLVIGCFIICGFGDSTRAANEPNKPGKDGAFLKFADVNRKKEKCSKILKEFCDEADIGVIHTYKHYKKIRQDIDSQEPPERTKAKLLLRGLSEIARRGFQDELDSTERIAILQQLLRLQRSVLKARPIGAGNVAVANQVSLLISGLIFQEVAESDISELDKIVPFTKHRVLDNHYTKQMLRGLMERELGYHTSEESDSEYDMLMKVVKTEYAGEFEKNRDKQLADVELLGKIIIFSPPSVNRKSRNPFTEMNSALFAFDLIILKEIEVLARLSVTYRKLHEEHDDEDKIDSEFKKTFIQNTNGFEKRIFANPKSEDELSNVISDINFKIKLYLHSSGKDLLSQSNRMCLYLSRDNGIFEE